MFSLVRCDVNGIPQQPIAVVSDELRSTYAANSAMHRRLGYILPWVSYVAVDAAQAVGGGAFVGPPRDTCVEIAYFTLTQYQRRSYATQTATHLIAIARQAMPEVTIQAYTLPEENASTRILRRLGLKFAGHARDEDAGEVWEWRG